MNGTINKARRSFLKLVPAMPFGASAAAKEAASSMGLSGPIGSATLSAHGLYAAQAGYPGVDSGNPWFIDELAKFSSTETMENQMNQARERARILDADIAALRSIAPAKAYQMQVSRYFDRIRKEQKTTLESRAQEWIKGYPAGAAILKRVLS